MSNPWICPKCDAVMAPNQPVCFYCKPKLELTGTHTKLDIKICDHDWDLSQVLTSYPAKYRCKKCGELMPFNLNHPMMTTIPASWSKIT